jgi:diguanylate cyclase (GGDEF)-like protein/PAS domain S-box-containing protein
MQQTIERTAQLPSAKAARLTGVYLLFASLSILIYYILDGQEQTVFYDFFGFFAVACIFLGVWLHRPAWPLPWVLIAIGIFVLKIADLTYVHYDRIFGTPKPFPSITEGLLFAGNTIIFLSIFLVLRSREPLQDTGNAIDAAIIATTAAALGWIFVMAPYASDESLSTFQLVAVLATPIYDLVTIVLLTRLVFGAGVRTPSFYLLLVGMLSCLVADIVYSEITLHTTFETGDWLDLGWILWFLMYAAAALHPSMAQIGEPGPSQATRLSGNRLLLLTAAALTVPVVALVQWQRDIDINIPVVIGASAITFVLVVMRMTGLINTAESARSALHRSLDREQVIGRTSLNFVSASSAEQVFESAARAIGEMIGDRGIGFVFNVDEQGEYAVVDGTRELHRAGNGAPLSTSVVPDELRDRLVDVESVTLDVAEYQSMWRHLRIPELLQFIVLAPAKVASRPRAVLGLAVNPVHEAESRTILTTLGSQVALALERVSLSEQLHLRQSEERFHSLVENASDLILILEGDGVVTWSSPSVSRVLELDDNDVTNRNFIDFVHPEDHAAAHQLLRYVTEGRAFVRSSDLRFRSGPSSWRSMEVTLNNLLDDPSLKGVVANARDVTERKTAEAKLAHLAYYDPLTDLPNRSWFTTLLNDDIRQAITDQRQTAVLFIDLDRFKLVNDSLGHEAGDALLREAGKRISANVRAGDTVARLGGDEFTVLISGFAHDDEPTAIARKILGAFTEPLLIGDREVFVDASIGIAHVTREVGDSTELLRRADIAMYRAKETGGQSIAKFDEAMGEDLLMRLDLETELRHAVERGQLEIYFQPEIDLAENRISAAEALLRWHHPRLGSVSPSDFIPLAEETGLILELGRWVLRNALVYAASWYEEHPDLDVTVSVNLSVRQYLHLGIVEDVARLLAETGVPPNKLRLELTETILMDEKTASRSVLERLDELGVQLAVDDFGSGYSNLGYLKRLPVEVLKIDQIFIRGLGHDLHDQAIVRAITELSHEMGLKVTAEGVETEDQLAIIRAVGCNSAQGFLFAHPSPASEFAERLFAEHMTRTREPSRH